MKADGENSASPPVIDHEHYVPFLITVISNSLYRAASPVYQTRFGVGVTEWRVLSALGVEPNTTANRVCNIAQLDKAAASRSLRVLEKGGYVAIEPHQTDARKRKVELTIKGRELHDNILRVALKRQEQILGGFAHEETQALIALLQRVRANLARLEDSE
ncbi:MAG TPA: MarR family winged helix-turn-helix transcriptional regulator [Micropepsaceae bacterium]|jgi:DNA-binding MarR family transcriptional regulator|nr:MarR family winged helix-turn-helix transcriptional regulator [Micropepsaceae bacterium]